MTRRLSGTFAAPTNAPTTLAVDAGVEHLRLRECAVHGRVIADEVVPIHGDLRRVFADRGLTERFGNGGGGRVIATGKLAPTAVAALGAGRAVLPAAALWLTARRLIHRPEHTGARTLALLDLSASGYLLVGVDRAGNLAHDLLVVNPRCGAGSGVNLDRVLQKLGVRREGVDDLLARYAGEPGRQRRLAVGTRADRCGVFASSATISDKNQGIPLADALATTLKSEVLKACRKLPPGFDHVHLTGRIFRWRFARECAEDFLTNQGVTRVSCDPEGTDVLEALADLSPRTNGDGHRPAASRSAPTTTADREYPGFAEIKRRYEADGRYRRLPSSPGEAVDDGRLAGRPIVMGLDVGSTMAKIVLADADDATVLFQAAYSNAGDTIETVKCAFRDIEALGVEALEVRGIGVTGSARYQVQQALTRMHPAATDRVSVLVENYAHARGSIALARRHVAELAARGVPVNRDFCVLVDIGGEDTKISTIALGRAELFDNAMNLKCSAGTGSLMDTLAALFGVPSVADACARAFEAPRSREINATCAVFLMENARKLQAEGVPRDEILAAANWAIVENMARTLWQQVELPANAVVLLHGQTMLSEPLPLAVTHRLQTFLNAPAYALVPPDPGHRACFGLVRTMMQAAPPGTSAVRLRDFLDATFEKRIIECRGAVCGDPQAVCKRTSLACCDGDGQRLTFTLGGCTAINERLGRKRAPAQKPVRDAYKEIWDLIATRHPHSDAPNRLVLARSFVVAEWAYLLARMFERFGIPVHVDDVRETDLMDAQGQFHIDTCAPHMGAVGQYRRLAAEPHGIILAPQIENLPTDGTSPGLTCTVNQGGLAVACSLAGLAHPEGRFHQFTLRLARLEAGALADQLSDQLGPVFARYGVSPSGGELRSALAGAIEDHLALKREAADLAAALAEEALDEGRQVALVVGRQYVLNPGLYDSSVRRLLRDKRMTAIPSYVLDVDLDPEFDWLYWRNPHVIVTVLNAVAEKTLHARVRHDRLARVFRQIECGDSLLPVVQVSTFSCGPDSVTSHLVARIMQRRPFLLLQSDAVLKELAHLENRMNTYVKQLDLGLHGELQIGDGQPFEVQRLDKLKRDAPLDRERDVIYFPTLGDNRPVTSVLRAAGFTCIDNWDEGFDLPASVQRGRQAAGDSVCAPLAAVYGDLLRAVDDFAERQAKGDMLVRDKRRLLYFDNQGDGPCRQGQYAEVHRLLAHGTFGGSNGHGAVLPGGASLQFLVGHERDGFDMGLEEWTLYRAYQSVVVQGVLQDLLFAGGVRCRSRDEHERLLEDYRVLKARIYGALESFTGPGAIATGLLGVGGQTPGVGPTLKYFAYRMHGLDLVKPLARFATRWIRRRRLTRDALRVHVSGEAYMRVAQAEALFDALLSILGFGRFHMTVSPLWAYLDYLPEASAQVSEQTVRAAAARQRRALNDDEDHVAGDEIRNGTAQAKAARRRSFALRELVARPLYTAAGLTMPPAARHLLAAAQEVLPTLRPHGELGPYVGEALTELRHGVDLFLSLAPTGCMVTSMGEVMTPRLQQAAGQGRIQSLFSSDGRIDEELLELALLRALGPERFTTVQGQALAGA